MSNISSWLILCFLLPLATLELKFHIMPLPNHLLLIQSSPQHWSAPITQPPPTSSPLLPVLASSHPWQVSFLSDGRCGVVVFFVTVNCGANPPRRCGPFCCRSSVGTIAGVAGVHDLAQPQCFVPGLGCGDSSSKFVRRDTPYFVWRACIC